MTLTLILIPISLQPNIVDHRYLKLKILVDQIIQAWYFKGLHYQICRDKGIRKFKSVTKGRRGGGGGNKLKRGEVARGGAKVESI